MSEASDFSSTYIVYIILNAFLCFTAIVLNCITIQAIRKTSSLPKPLKTLLLSLAVSDLSVGLLVHPLNIALYYMRLEGYARNNKTFSMTSFAFVITGNILAWASFMGVLALTVDRFLAIHLHLRYQEFVTHKRAVAVVIFIMVFSSFLFSLPLWIPDHWAKIYGSIAIVCVALITIFYCKIYSTVRRHRNQIQSLQVQQDEGQNPEMVANVARLVKLAVGTFYVYLVFLLCYLPHISILTAFVMNRPDNTRLHISFFTFMIVLLNSSLNPLIYCWKMRDIRRAVINIMQNIFPCYS